jgi:hypothetical protein
VESLKDDATPRQIARITGYWADGIFKGFLIAIPPLLMLGLVIGGAVRVARQATKLGGID